MSKKPQIYKNEDVVVGAKFGKLIITSLIKGKYGHPYVTYKCDCGKEGQASRWNITHGQRCCGCEKPGNIKNGLYSKGGHERFGKIFKGIKQRCNNPKNPAYNRYGGRGIKVLWQTVEEFKNDMLAGYIEHSRIYGEENTSIDRIDNNGDYCKENCRRVTNEEQANNKRSALKVEYQGKIYTSKELADYCGISRQLAQGRINRFNRGLTTLDVVFKVRTNLNFK